MKVHELIAKLSALPNPDLEVVIPALTVCCSETGEWTNDTESTITDVIDLERVVHITFNDPNSHI